MARTLTRDVELHDEKMPSGGKVLLLLGSGNRDERVWNEPDRFDIDREWPTHHIAFGHGIHVCLGAALARLEMRVSMEEFLTRSSALRDRRRRTRTGAFRKRPRVLAHADHAPMTQSDEVAITALIHEYAFRLDAGDFDGVAELFAARGAALDAARQCTAGYRRSARAVRPGHRLRRRHAPHTASAHERDRAGRRRSRVGPLATSRC